jgi:hypothetical protein
MTVSFEDIQNKYLAYLEFLNRYQKFNEEDKTSLLPHLQHLRKTWREALAEHRKLKE